MVKEQHSATQQATLMARPWQKRERTAIERAVVGPFRDGAAGLALNPVLLELGAVVMRRVNEAVRVIQPRRIEILEVNL